MPSRHFKQNQYVREIDGPAEFAVLLDAWQKLPGKMCRVGAVRNQSLTLCRLARS
jgi:hypothetical protein